MSPTHRPDYKTWSMEFRQSSKGETLYRDAYLFPYINIEDLSHGSSLLHLLHSRGHTLPEAFANADFQATRIGWKTQAIILRPLEGYTMVLTGQTTADSYGQLLPLRGSSDAWDRLMHALGKEPTAGLLILEIQAKLLGFLVKCCNVVLADIPADSLTDTPIQSSPGPVPTHPAAWASLAAMLKEAPCQVPASPDFRRLEAVIVASFSAAKDHLWALREDPGYFAMFAIDCGEHRWETICDVKGRTHPDYNTQRFWDSVLRELVIHAYELPFLWDALQAQVVQLINLKEGFAREIFPNKKLPSKYLDELLYFRFLLDKAIESRIRRLRMIAPPSPPLRSFSLRQPQILVTNVIAIERRKGTASKYQEALNILWDDEACDCCGLPSIMEELERALVESQKSLVSSLVAGTISDLSVLGEALRQLDLYQSVPNFYLCDNTRDDEIFKASYEKTRRLFSRFATAIKGVSLAEVGTPSDGFFYYPIEKRKTRGHVEAIRETEHRLDTFWEHLDDQVTRKDDELGDFEYKVFGSNERKLQRSPEWLEPDEKSESNKVEAPYIPLAQIDLNGKATSHQIAEEKVKPKTRGIAHPSPAVKETTEVIADRVSLQPTIAVSKRALKTFRVLFYIHSSQSNAPGEVSWSDFLHAMQSAGFQIEKLYGSVWQFTPTRLDVETSIQFHEPHPQGKIPFVMARRHGRRLTRTYGWSGNTFVVKEGGT